MESAITSKGQATIPKAVRDYLHVKPGDRIKFFMHPDGGVYILPKLPAGALRGMDAGPNGQRQLRRWTRPLLRGRVSP
jgi:AbrB family looped-hinge helix DNA binding protein